MEADETREPNSMKFLNFPSVCILICLGIAQLSFAEERTDGVAWNALTPESLAVVSAGTFANLDSQTISKIPLQVCLDQ